MSVCASSLYVSAMFHPVAAVRPLTIIEDQWGQPALTEGSVILKQCR